ncbi:MAG: alpha-E domain-containing protein, partial [Cyclobacteriaceae bacterium]|nr:alpha-E domain-containing protein [Cyclobacteriaceae bacterium]
MLSRVADSIYWMNRYIERAENYARYMDVNFNLTLELPPDISSQWKPLVVTTGDWSLYESLYEKEDKAKIIYFLGYDIKNPNSIYSCIVNARENARSIRPEITKE